MTPFVHLEGVAAPLLHANVDTDKILPGRFLKTISRTGLGAALFASQREDRRFILNRAPWNTAQILVALDNFGCGSSREHAPWALLDFGIRCVIAPSIADIFYGNCLKNGILPVVLSRAEVDALLAIVSDPRSARLAVDLEAQTVTTVVGAAFRFDIDGMRKDALLRGADEITRTLELSNHIERYEAGRVPAAAWSAAPTG